MVMRYLLDTNVWIVYLKRPESPVEMRLRATPASEIAVCSVIWAELLHGARSTRQQDELASGTDAVPFSVPFDDDAARHYAEIRDELEIKGQIIGPYDLLIAAIARSHGLTVDFIRQPGV